MTQIVRIGGGSKKQYPADIVGAKAANLARMAAIGLPVPPAFVLPIEPGVEIARGGGQAKQRLADSVVEGIGFLEKATGCSFGDRRRPLLVSVRSGAARSMPGMLDTVLNVGCSLAAVQGLVRTTGNPRFAWDCRRRFLESYADVVLEIEPSQFERRRNVLAAAERVENEHALDGEALEHLSESYLQVIEDEEHSVSENPMDQLTSAIQAVYQSWMSERACAYRRLEHLEDLRGTAVTVQAMVFGNRSPGSGAGVAFSRDPSNGMPKPVIDVLFESQGEDVVSGRRNPETEDAIARSAPTVARNLRETLARLEQEFEDVQDVEFTIEEGKLWILQTRSAKRTPLAAVRFAIDFVKEGKVTPREALRRLEGLDLNALTRKRLTDVGDPVARGIGASAGIAVGRAAFNSDIAERLAATGPVILVRPDTSTSDVAGFAVSEGIVTAVGGRTAHAALVARQMGKPCTVGCSALKVDVEHHRAQLAGSTINEGDWLSIDGEAGSIYLGQGKIVVERLELELREIERWRAT